MLIILPLQINSDVNLPALQSASLIVSDQVLKELQEAAGSSINTAVNYSVGLGLAFGGNFEERTNNNEQEPLKGYRSAFWLGADFAGLGVILTFPPRNKMQGYKQG